MPSRSHCVPSAFQILLHVPREILGGDLIWPLDKNKDFWYLLGSGHYLMHGPGA